MGSTPAMPSPGAGRKSKSPPQQCRNTIPVQNLLPFFLFPFVGHKWNPRLCSLAGLARWQGVLSCRQHERRGKTRHAPKKARIRCPAVVSARSFAAMHSTQLPPSNHHQVLRTRHDPPGLAHIGKCAFIGCLHLHETPSSRCRQFETTRFRILVKSNNDKYS